MFLLFVPAITYAAGLLACTDDFRESPIMELIESRSDVVVVGNRDENFATLLASVAPNQTIVDPVRIMEPPATDGAGYYGICW